MKIEGACYPVISECPLNESALTHLKARGVHMLNFKEESPVMSLLHCRLFSVVITNLKHQHTSAPYPLISTTIVSSYIGCLKRIQHHIFKSSFAP